MRKCDHTFLSIFAIFITFLGFVMELSCDGRSCQSIIPLQGSATAVVMVEAGTQRRQKERVAVVAGEGCGYDHCWWRRVAGSNDWGGE
ncbi:hypothetical protein GW17_00033552 [Ensete ventricosum]|nr:hypothetical protein GW17_00033552 [Ensete ventricosum]